jgi:hypothetical protein
VVVEAGKLPFEAIRTVAEIGVIRCMCRPHQFPLIRTTREYGLNGVNQRVHFQICVGSSSWCLHCHCDETREIQEGSGEDG